MEKNEREKVFQKMVERALKEKFSKLSRSYDRNLIWRTWAKSMESPERRLYFGDLKQWEDKTFAQLFEGLEDYFVCLEILLQDRVKRFRNQRRPPPPRQKGTSSGQPFSDNGRKDQIPAEEFPHIRVCPN